MVEGQDEQSLGTCRTVQNSEGYWEALALFWNALTILKFRSGTGDAKP